MKILLLAIAFTLAQIVVIESESDIKKIEIGTIYVIGGPNDPLEYYDFERKLQPKIDQHIEKLQAKNKYDRRSR